MQRTEVTIPGRKRKARPSLSKPLLYGTSALAGAGMLVGGSSGAAAQETKIEWNVFGFINNYYGFTDVDEADGSNADFNEFTTHWDGEYQFGGKTVLDNGLEFGVRSEIEMPVRAADDEQYMWIEHPTAGLLYLGGDNTAMYRMGLGIWGAGGVGVPINSGWLSDFVPAAPGFEVSFRSPSVSTAIDITNDDNTITYFTPRIAGFQFGASYAPNPDFSDGAPSNGPVDDNAAAIGYKNGFGAGVNYVTEAAGFNFGVSGGFAHATANDFVEANGGDDIKQFMTGITLGFGGLSLDASFANELDGRHRGFDANGLARTTEGWSAVGGVSYTVGPWAASASWLHSQVEGDRSNDDDDELDAVQGSVGYTIGPGIDWGATVLYVDWEDENAGSQDGYSIASGFKLSF